MRESHVAAARRWRNNSQIAFFVFLLISATQSQVSLSIRSLVLLFLFRKKRKTIVFASDMHSRASFYVIQYLPQHSDWVILNANELHTYAFFSPFTFQSAIRAMQNCEKRVKWFWIKFNYKIQLFFLFSVSFVHCFSGVSSIIQSICCVSFNWSICSHTGHH